MRGSACGWMGFDLTPLRLVWLGLALVGAVLGLPPGLPDASGAVAALTLALWSLIETTLRRNWPGLLTLPALALGLGCALPLYLFLRSRRIV